MENQSQKKGCISLGINFYGTIMNLLSKEYGTYYPNLFDKKILNEFNNLVLTCDHCLYSCYNIEKFYRSKKIPIRISGLIPTILQPQFLNSIV